MRHFASYMSVVALAGLMMPAIGSDFALAASQKEYTSPGSVKKMLLQEPLHGMKDEQVTIMQVTFPPGWKGGKHYHTGSVYVYVLKGSFMVHEKGKNNRTISAGELYREPVGNPMVAQNASTSKPTEVLLMQVGQKGKPLMVKTDF